MLKIILTAINVTSKGMNPLTEVPSIFISMLKVSANPPEYFPDNMSLISCVTPPSYTLLPKFFSKSISSEKSMSFKFSSTFFSNSSLISSSALVVALTFDDINGNIQSVKTNIEAINKKIQILRFNADF